MTSALASTSYSHAQCIGSLATAGLSASSLVRNPGGGTAPCCWMHPIAAPARVAGAAMQLQLQPRDPAKVSRNSARVYLADSCTEGDYASTTYASPSLLGKTLSLTADLSRSMWLQRGVLFGEHGAEYAAWHLRRRLLLRRERCMRRALR